MHFVAEGLQIIYFLLLARWPDFEIFVHLDLRKTLGKMHCLQNYLPTVEVQLMLEYAMRLVSTVKTLIIRQRFSRDSDRT